MRGRGARAVVLALAVASFAGCTSTGDPARPIRFYGWRMYVFGHEKYTPQEAAYERCVYRNRLPDGSRTGFRRACRLEATRFPMGINSAMFASGCVMEKCHEVAATVP